MRTTEERTELILKKTEKIKAHRRRLRTAVLHSCSCCACAVLIVLCAINLPRVGSSDSISVGDESAAATLLAQNPAIGYIIMAILAFLLGVCVTALMFRIKLREPERKHAEPEEHREL